ncbi:glycosyltransferase [Sulfuritalea sp.]|uniref:glycosyltransferase n=1 Tax=Sulfuritalea sp. TaxID=2480090 RepID=UPI001ACC14B4|nr:glycosyltransferase [Sulfuritalea sp.]MBN8474887.1 glycosyltransferase [Sulfuritalea sp.]
MAESADPRTTCGVVVIGRNEGERLRRCIDSVANVAGPVVYVDSGSSDGSVAMARSRNVSVVEIDMTVPFTAARARNAGFAHLREVGPGLAFVQFVDGDCEVDSAWLGKAVDFLTRNPEVVAVCGRRRERFPEQSIYNALCDMEWDTPVGEARACGGDSMMRIDAFESVGGFRADLIAGEEPELCVRLRASGGKIWRLGAEMTLHDAAMTHIGQWWKRAKRAGYAFAEGANLHGAPPERHYVPQARRALLWGLAMPVAIAAATIVDPVYLGLLLLYPLQVLRIVAKSRMANRMVWWRAVFQVLGRFPEGIGTLYFLRDRLFRRKGMLIEYK